MNRRKFVQHSMVVGAGMALTPSLISACTSSSSIRKLTVLHTNDTHSNIDPFDINHSKYPNRGGVARRYDVIQEIRSQEENVLLLDAGDIFQGTPYFNKFGGTLELKLMSQMGYDCATMGNHDFDGGLDGFQNALKYANFPFVCSNYDFSNTQLDQLTSPYQVFQKGAIKVGVFGIGIELAGLVPSACYGETQFIDPILVANQTATYLSKEEKCDLVIALSHLGNHSKQHEMCDPILAKETENIDLIIGGHTHTFMDEPAVHLNKAGKKVLVNQVGWGGLALGRIDFFLDDDKASQPYQLQLI